METWKYINKERKKKICVSKWITIEEWEQHFMTLLLSSRVKCFLFRRKWELFRVVLCLVAIVLYFGSANATFLVKKKHELSSFKSKVPFVRLFRRKWELIRIVLRLIAIVPHFDSVDTTLSIETWIVYLQEKRALCMFVSAKMRVVLGCSMYFQLKCMILY